MFSLLTDPTYKPLALAIAAIGGIQSVFSACGLLLLVVFIAHMVFHDKHVGHRLKIAFAYIASMSGSVLALHLLAAYSNWHPSPELIMLSRAYFGLLIGIFVLSALLHLESLIFKTKFHLGTEHPLRKKLHNFIEKVGVPGAILQAIITTFLIADCYLTATQDSLNVIAVQYGFWNTLGLLLVHVLFFILVYVIIYALLLRFDKWGVKMELNSTRRPWLRVVKALLQGIAAYVIYKIIF